MNTREASRIQFAPGQRVAARPNTDWDDLGGFADGELAYLQLHGHHGHVVANCSDAECEWSPHVHWEGVHDGRVPGPTSWTDGTIWHMSDDEIEHID